MLQYKIDAFYLALSGKCVVLKSLNTPDRTYIKFLVSNVKYRSSEKDRTSHIV